MEGFHSSSFTVLYIILKPCLLSQIVFIIMIPDDNQNSGLVLSVECLKEFGD